MATPRLVFDDDCGFCTWWAEYIADRSDVTLVGFSELTAELRNRLPEDYEDCSHLVTDDGVYSCGESIEEGLLRSGGDEVRSVVERLRGVETYETAREWGYHHVAHNRRLWGRLFSKTPPVRRDSNDAR